MYLEGTDAVSSDNATALRWFTRAAEQGSPVGQSGLGLMYLTGRGLPKDPSKALQYFSMAAEQGTLYFFIPRYIHRPYFFFSFR